MGREEQTEEREVLESIFPDEITDVSDDEFRLLIKLDLPDEILGKDDEGVVADPPAMVLTVRYPEDYPDKEPHLELSAPVPGTDDVSTHALFNVADDKDDLLAGLQETIQENLGMAMVFTLVSALKEAAEQLVTTRHETETKKQEEALLEAERVENAKFHGTPVNRETFLKWRDEFVQEIADKKRREEEERLADMAKRNKGGGGGIGVGKDGIRLTGRQLWERGLVGKVDDDDDAAGPDEEDGAPTEGVAKLGIQA